MWRSEACKTFWLIHQHRCWEWPAGKSRLFYGSFVTSIITHIWYAFMKKVNKAEIDMLHKGHKLWARNSGNDSKSIPVLLSACLTWHVDLVYRTESEHEIIELWTPVFGQVLTFKMYMQVFLKSAWKYKSTYWFFSLQYEKTLLQFLNVSQDWVKVDREWKNGDFVHCTEQFDNLHWDRDKCATW